MKTITIINWLLIGLYGLLLLISVFHLNRPGNDAAGRGMESGLLILGVLLLAAMVGLNMLPYTWAKITAMIIQVLPLAVVIYNLASNYFESQQD